MSSSTLRQHKDIRWSNDLSSYQIWSVLVNILYEAAAPLAVYGDLSLETALSCLSLSTDKRRQISEDKQDELKIQLFDELAHRADPKKFDEISRLDLLEFLLTTGIERNIIVDHIVYTLQTNNLAGTAIHMKKLRRHIQQCLEDYEAFKQDVVYRYYYLIETEANRNKFVKESVGLSTTKRDMFHAYVISSMRAIDRFVPFKGHLTPYIQGWFQNASGSSDYVVYDGEAFSLNRNVRKSIQEGDRKGINNRAIPIHDREDTFVDDTKATESSTFPDFTRHIAKLPNASLVFVAQNLPYILDREQKRRVEISNRIHRSETNGPNSSSSNMDSSVDGAVF